MNTKWKVEIFEDNSMKLVAEEMGFDSRESAIAWADTYQWQHDGVWTQVTKDTQAMLEEGNSAFATFDTCPGDFGAPGDDEPW
jgi:hypothetical protein